MQVSAHPSLVICHVKVIVTVTTVSCCCPLHCVSIDNVLSIVPFTGEHVITDGILGFYPNSTKDPQSQGDSR